MVATIESQPMTKRKKHDKRHSILVPITFRARTMKHFETKDRQTKHSKLLQINGKTNEIHRKIMYFNKCLVQFIEQDVIERNDVYTLKNQSNDESQH